MLLFQRSRFCLFGRASCCRIGKLGTKAHGRGSLRRPFSRMGAGRFAGRLQGTREAEKGRSPERLDARTRAKGGAI